VRLSDIRFHASVSITLSTSHSVVWPEDPQTMQLYQKDTSILVTVICSLCIQISPYFIMSVIKSPTLLDVTLLHIVEPTSEAERTTHQSSCYWGCPILHHALVVFLKYPINKCNYSICTQNGYLFVYPCRRDVVFTTVALLTPHHPHLFECSHISLEYENLASYRFNTKEKPYKFCKTCGTSILADFDRANLGQTDPEKDILAVSVCSSFPAPPITSGFPGGLYSEPCYENSMIDLYIDV